MSTQQHPGQHTDHHTGQHASPHTGAPFAVAHREITWREPWLTGVARSLYAAVGLLAVAAIQIAADAGGPVDPSTGWAVLLRGAQALCLGLAVAAALGDPERRAYVRSALSVAVELDRAVRDTPAAEPWTRTGPRTSPPSVLQAGTSGLRRVVTTRHVLAALGYADGPRDPFTWVAVQRFPAERPAASGHRSTPRRPRHVVRVRFALHLEALAHDAEHF